jgi:protein-export membrane protein SecD
MSSQKWRIGLTIALTLVACFAFWHTFRFWTMSETEKTRMQTNTPGEYLALQQKAIRLGLDLQGGIHVVLRVKMEQLNSDERKEAVDRAMSIIRNRIDGLGVAEPIILKQGDDRIVVDLPGYTDANRAEELIGQTAILEFKLLENYDNSSLVMNRLDSAIHAYELAKKGKTPSEAKPAETPKETAKAPADTSKKPEDLLAKLTSDTAQKSAASTDTANADDEDDLAAEENPLTVRLDVVLSRNGVNWPGWSVNKKEKPTIERWLALPEIQRLIPPDLQLAWSTRSALRQGILTYEIYMLKRKVEMKGNALETVALSRADYGEYAVDFQLSGNNATKFAQVTGSNIDRPLAIVLDDRVESAAFINSKIRNRGQITMGSGAQIEDARNLEIVLKAGSLPAPVEIIEKNVVGATLGADSINKGLMSSIVGLLAVLLYIGIYYRLSGLIADIGLLFNMFFLLAILAGVSATLTMPGIAGIILTIGISVDSNILIFERIREELRTGKTVRAAIDAGYTRAFTTILDSHVTTLITAAVLFYVGSGPVRGFAVTLFWGVALSLFTAYVITKVIFDFRKGYKTLSI